MRLLPRARTVRRSVLGLAVGAVGGWIYGLLQAPPTATAPASTSLSAPPPPPEPAVPAEIADALRAPEPEPVAEPILVPDPVQVPAEETPVAPGASDAAEAMRTASTRARARLSAATDALAGEGPEPAAKKIPVKRVPKKADPGPGSAVDEA